MSYIKRGTGAYDAASNEPYFPFSPNKASGGSCGCGCGGGCGMGYFTSMDPSTWGVAEWGTVAGVGYLGLNTLMSHPAVKSGGKRARKAASKGVSNLSTIALWGAAAYGAWYLWNQYQTTGSIGFGDYQKQGFVNPQILSSPVGSSAISIPVGW